MASVYKPPCDEGVIRGAPCAPAGTARSAAGSGHWVLAAAILGSSLAFVDGTAVNVALPALQRDLGASATGVQWVVEAYALLLAGLLLAGGAAGDRFGRRKVFAVGVAGFAAASAACGLAPGLSTLVAARALQGAAAALLVPGSLALISSAFGEAERGRAIGTWSGATALTAALGPVLGGWLVDHGGWRWVFFLNLPAAAAVLAITLTRVPESRDPDARGLDWPGALLATLALAGLTFGLLESAHRGFADPAVAGSLAAGAAALAGFLFVEGRHGTPAADDAAGALSLPRLRRRQPADLLPLCRDGRSALLPPLRPRPGPGLLGDRGGRRAAADDPSALPPLPLVRRLDRPLRRPAAA